MSLRVNVRKALIAVPVLADTAYFHGDRRTVKQKIGQNGLRKLRKAIKPQQTHNRYF